MLVASVVAATQQTPKPVALERGAIRLRPGTEKWGPEELAERLAGERWERVSLVTAPGEFSIRGDIVDVFPPGRSTPVRLEYFGDELESIRPFDQQTQRAAGSLPELEISTGGDAFGTLLDHFGRNDPVFLVAPDEEMCALVGNRPGADLDDLRAGERPYEVRQVEPVAAGAEKLRERIVEACEGVPHAYFENPTDELRAACESAAQFVSSVRKVG